MGVAWLIRRLFPVRYAVEKSRQENALSIMVSFAADIDLVSDWIFCFLVLKEKSGIVPQVLLAFTVIATITWFLYVTNGRVLYAFNCIIAPRKINAGFVSFACVLSEDIPQLVLTFLIEDEFSSIATLNLICLLYTSDAADDP